MLSRYEAQSPFTTKDGSQIRELMHPDVHGNHRQSLAEARVPPGETTALHRHGVTEELYHVTAGRGRMTLGQRSFDVIPGNTIAIPPGTPHCIHNPGDETLVFLCCCSPPYRHDDTELL